MANVEATANTLIYFLILEFTCSALAQSRAGLLDGASNNEASPDKMKVCDFSGQPHLEEAF